MTLTATNINISREKNTSKVSNAKMQLRVHRAVKDFKEKDYSFLDKSSRSNSASSFKSAKTHQKKKKVDRSIEISKIKRNLDLKRRRDKAREKRAQIEDYKNLVKSI